MALWALGACGGRLHVPENPGVGAPACTLVAPPSTTGDSATFDFHAIGTTREQCALSIVAENLRPWPLASSEPWAVHLTVTPADATVRALRGDVARDAIDGGSMLLATDDLDLVAYAASRPDLDVTPLSWDRTYVHLSPARQPPLGAGAGPDAVRVDARLAETPPCDSLITPAASPTDSPPSRRVLYDAADRTARELAARIVALADRADVTAVGLPGAALDDAVQRGADLAYIVSMPRASYCDALAALSHRAPWLTSAVIVPLIDTRAHAIAPRAPRP
jgi:hypothetical protein